MIRKFLEAYGTQKPSKREVYKHALKRREAQIGGELFGPVRPGGRREFFCLDRHTWVWYEEWVDNNGQRQSVTTRYEVRPDGVLKAQDGSNSYHYVSLDEGKRLYDAATRYNQRVQSELYSFAN